MANRYKLGRHRGHYVAEWISDDAKRHRAALYWNGRRPDTEADARAALRELEETRERKALADQHTLGDLYEAYVSYKERRGKDTGRMISAWKALGPFWGRISVETLREDDGYDYIEQRRDQGVSDGGIRTELAYLQAAINWRYRKGTGPQIEKPPAGRVRETWISREDGSRLIEGAVEPHARIAIMLLCAFACRPLHLLQLTKDRVDREKGIVMLDDPTRDRTKKGRATVPINEMARAALEIAWPITDTHVIEWNGQPIKSLKRAIGEAARRAGVAGVTPYVLRKSAGRWMVEDGVEMALVSQYMGHSSVAVTEKHYARFSPDYLRRAASSLDLKPGQGAARNGGMSNPKAVKKPDPGTSVPRSKQKTLTLPREKPEL
jgi:integrase